MTTASTTNAPPKLTTPVPRGATRRQIGRRWILGTMGLFVVVAGAGAFYYLRPSAGAGAATESYQVTRRSFTIVLNEKGEIEATKSVDVKCEVEGRSTIIWLIDEGTEVTEGELLVKIASNEIDDRVRAEQIKAQNALAASEAANKELEIALDQHKSDIRKAELALHDAEIEFKKYTEGDYLQQLMDKELALETTTKTFKQKDGIFQDSQELNSNGFLTARELDDRALQRLQAEVAQRKAKLDLKIFKDYTHPKERDKRASDIEEARKELERTIKKTKAEAAKLRATTAAKEAESNLTTDRLKKLEEQQTKTEIRAPASGLVVYDTGRNRWSRSQIVEGAEVYERQSIITLPDTSQMLVKLRIHEAKTSQIAIGQKAVVEIEGIPDVSFTGKVTKIAPLADSQNTWLNPDLKEYATEVTLEKSDRNLKPGVTARVEILVREVENVLAVPVQAIFSRGGHHYAFVGKNQKIAHPVEIKIGDSSDEYVEVTNGLKEGDTILLAVDGTLFAEIPDVSKDGKPQKAQHHSPSNKAPSNKGKTKKRTSQGVSH